MASTTRDLRAAGSVLSAHPRSPPATREDYSPTDGQRQCRNGFWPTAGDSFRDGYLTPGGLISN